MIFGHDYLGGAHYQKAILSAHPQGWAAGFFGPKILGDPTNTIDALLATGKCPVVRIQVCYRQDHNYGMSDLNDFISYADRINPIIDKYPNVEFRISAFCEHKITDANFLQRTLAEAIAHYHRCFYVNSIMPGGLTPPNIPVVEFHGGGKPTTPRYEFSYDGVAAEDADTETDKKNFGAADIFFFWGARFNGKWAANDTTPINQRNGWPDSNYIQALSFLGTPKGDTSLPNNWIWKSFSENKGTGDPRAGRPVCITPVKASQIILQDSKGNVIDVLPFYGPYVDGRYRYYSKNFGYNRAQKALNLSGSPVCSVIIQGKKYGTVNPAFRDGNFR